jgi:hypothetical protein
MPRLSKKMEMTCFNILTILGHAVEGHKPIMYPLKLGESG